jgi:hypothetical protein
VIRGRVHLLWAGLLWAGLTSGGLGACGPAFLVLAKIDDALEAHRDQQLPPYLCGNAICDRERGESCRSCSADCGPCDKAAPELVALTPESGKANRWVSVFGTHLGSVERMWMAQGDKLLLLRHRRVSTRLEIFIPAGSTSGTLHVQVHGKRRSTKLSYDVRP